MSPSRHKDETRDFLVAVWGQTVLPFLGIRKPSCARACCPQRAGIEKLMDTFFGQALVPLLIFRAFTSGCALRDDDGKAAGFNPDTGREPADVVSVHFDRERPVRFQSEF